MGGTDLFVCKKQAPPSCAARPTLGQANARVLFFSPRSDPEQTRLVYCSLNPDDTHSTSTLEARRHNQFDPTTNSFRGAAYRSTCAHPYRWRL